jgi:hypothetical protein
MFGEIAEVPIGEHNKVLRDLVVEVLEPVAVGYCDRGKISGNRPDVRILCPIVFECLQVKLSAIRKHFAGVRYRALPLGNKRNRPFDLNANHVEQPLCARQCLRAGGVDIAVPEAAHGKHHELRVAKAQRAGMQLVTSRRGAEQWINQLRIATKRLKTMAHRALDPGAGKARMMGVPFPLDRIVDYANGGAGAHVDRSQGVEEYGNSLLKHDRVLPLHMLQGSPG